MTMRLEASGGNPTRQSNAQLVLSGVALAAGRQLRSLKLVQLLFKGWEALHTTPLQSVGLISAGLQSHGLVRADALFCSHFGPFWPRPAPLARDG